MQLAGSNMPTCVVGRDDANGCMYCPCRSVGPHAAPFEDDDEARKGILWTECTVASAADCKKEIVYITGVNVRQHLLPKSLYSVSIFDECRMRTVCDALVAFMHAWNIWCERSVTSLRHRVTRITRRLPVIEHYSRATQMGRCDIGRRHPTTVTWSGYHILNYTEAIHCIFFI